ncbi:MAG: hypothetical protein OEY52_17405, partial [Gammaproteobacteria bacterium]|nr:hypothetical protein [Gammaproteobacteria bacterium]
RVNEPPIYIFVCVRSVCSKRKRSIPFTRSIFPAPITNTLTQMVDSLHPLQSNQSPKLSKPARVAGANLFL